MSNFFYFEPVIYIDERGHEIRANVIDLHMNEDNSGLDYNIRYFNRAPGEEVYKDLWVDGKYLKAFSETKHVECPLCKKALRYHKKKHYEKFHDSHYYNYQIKPKVNQFTQYHNNLDYQLTGQYYNVFSPTDK